MQSFIKIFTNYSKEITSIYKLFLKNLMLDSFKNSYQKTIKLLLNNPKITIFGE